MEYINSITSSDTANVGAVFLDLKYASYSLIQIDNIGAREVTFFTPPNFEINGHIEVFNNPLDIFFQGANGQTLDNFTLHDCSTKGVNEIKISSTSISITSSEAAAITADCNSLVAKNFHIKNNFIIKANSSATLSEIVAGNLTTNAPNVHADTITAVGSCNITTEKGTFDGKINAFSDVFITCQDSKINGEIKAANSIQIITERLDFAQIASLMAKNISVRDLSGNLIGAPWRFMGAINASTLEIYSPKTECIQEGKMSISQQWNAECGKINLQRPDLLDVNQYQLKGDIRYSGLLDAKGGDLILSYTCQDVDNSQKMRAFGKVSLTLPGIFTNREQIVANSFYVNGASFHNYKYVSINTATTLHLKDVFYNHVRSEANLGQLHISREDGGQINKVTNEGKITSGDTKLYTRSIEKTATGFSKKVVEEKQRHRDPKSKWAWWCSISIDEVVNFPIRAYWKCTGDFYLYDSTFITTSSSLYILGKLYSDRTTLIKTDYKLFQSGDCEHWNHWGESDIPNRAKTALAAYGGVMQSEGNDWYWGTWSTRNNPGIKQVYLSSIHAVKGIEGSMAGLELDASTTLALPQSELGTNLITYDANAKNSLAQVAAAQHNIFENYLKSALKSSGYTLDIFSRQIPLTFILNPNLYKLTMPGLNYIIERDPDIIEHSNKALVPLNFNFGFMLQEFFSTELSKLGPLDPLFLIGDAHYLEQLFEDQIFTSIGVIAGMDNSRLAEVLIGNAINKVNGEAILAQNRGMPFEVGRELTTQQKNLLTKPIAWFVYRDNCLDTGKRCLYPKVYFNEASLENFVWETISSEEGIVLKISGKALIGATAGLRGKNIVIEADGPIINIGTITAKEQINLSSKQGILSVGQITTLGDIAVAAANIALANKIKAEGNITLEASMNIAIQTLVAVMEYGENVESKIALETQIESGGAVKIAGQNLKIAGVRVLGRQVYINAEDKVYIVPVELYQKVVQRGKKYYHEYQSLTLYKSSIETLEPNTFDEKTGVVRLSKEIAEHGGPSTIVFKANEILLDSTDVTADKVEFHAGEKGVVLRAGMEFTLDYSQKTKLQGGVPGAFGNTKTRAVTVYHAQSIYSRIRAKAVEIFTSGRVEIGFDIIAHVAKFNREGASLDAAVRFIPRTNVRYIKVETKTSGWMFKQVGDRFMFAGHITKSDSHQVTEVIPTVIGLIHTFGDPDSPPQFVVNTPHGCEIISSSIEEWEDPTGKIVERSKRELVIAINARDIELRSIPNLEGTFGFVGIAGGGIGWSAKSGEVAIELGLVTKQEEKVTLKATHKNPPTLLGGFAQLHATNSIRDMAAHYDLLKMDMHAKIIFHSIAEDVTIETSAKTLMEAGAKLGIKSGSLGRMIDAGKRYGEQDAERPEGWINAGFAAFEIYHNILKLLAGKGGMGGGAWAFAHYFHQESETVTIVPQPTKMQLEQLNITVEEWNLHGTQIETMRAYFKTKSLKTRAAEFSNTATTEFQEFDVEIPLTGSAPAGFSAAFGKSKSNTKLMMYTLIHVHEDLQLQVEGHADMQGIRLSAKNLEAFFNSLLLESVQDLATSDQWGASLGLSTKDISSIGAQIGKGKRHVVREISSIIGTEKANIVVANALRLNWAMIAAAQRAEDGSYTDHGALTLRAGQFFFQHIYDYDNGYTLGAAISSDAFMPTIGGHSGSGYTFATIGKGDVECTKPDGICQFDSVNRDTTKTQEWHTDYDVQPIKGYIPLGEMPKLPKMPDGSIDWDSAGENVKAQVAGILKSINSIFHEDQALDNSKAKSKENVDAEEPINAQDDDQEENHNKDENSDNTKQETNPDQEPLDNKQDQKNKKPIEVSEKEFVQFKHELDAEEEWKKIARRVNKDSSTYKEVYKDKKESFDRYVLELMYQYKKTGVKPAINEGAFDRYEASEHLQLAYEGLKGIKEAMHKKHVEMMNDPNSKNYQAGAKVIGGVIHVAEKIVKKGAELLVGTATFAGGVVLDSLVNGPVWMEDDDLVNNEMRELARLNIKKDILDSCIGIKDWAEKEYHDLRPSDQRILSISFKGISTALKIHGGYKLTEAMLKTVTKIAKKAFIIGLANGGAGLAKAGVEIETGQLMSYLSQSMAAEIESLQTTGLGNLANKAAVGLETKAGQGVIKEVVNGGKKLGHELWEDTKKEAGKDIAHKLTERTPSQIRENV